MSDTAQTAVFDFLATPEAFGGRDGAVTRMETHISALFLWGDAVLKAKKAVALPYLDFTPLRAREQACRAEVSLNGPTAPGLYKGVRAVTREANGVFALDGDGTVIDWVVEMARFDQDDLLDAHARAGKLDANMMEALADAIGTYHAARPVLTQAGGAAGVRAIIDNNAEAFQMAAPDVFDVAQVAALTAAQHAECDRVSALLDARRDQGRVRRCHGDMHLRNIVMWQGRPTLFDAIEFNDLFTDIDVFYDVSFLLMDLDHRGLKDLASVVMNRYADGTGDGAGAVLLPLFLSLRAAIRAHVGGVAVKHDGAMASEARTYLAQAEGYLTPPSPRLIAVGGLSGSGKSGAARRLAPHLGDGLGARVVRTDAMRKRLAGVGLLDRLPPESYTKEASQATYQAVYKEAKSLLDQGVAVIADGVFAAPGERAAIEAVARAAGVPFDGVWLEAPPNVMAARADARTGNVSDANGQVVTAQLGYELGDVAWSRVDSSGPRQQTLAGVLRSVGLSV